MNAVLPVGNGGMYVDGSRLGAQPHGRQHGAHRLHRFRLLRQRPVSFLAPPASSAIFCCRRESGVDGVGVLRRLFICMREKEQFGIHSVKFQIIAVRKRMCGRAGQIRNKVFVVNPEMMKVESTFDAHPRRESQVRQMAWIGDGVW